LLLASAATACCAWLHASDAHMAATLRVHAIVLQLHMLQVIDMCGSDPRLRQYCNCSKLLLMGHSRGAKLSCLIADQVSVAADPSAGH